MSQPSLKGFTVVCGLPGSGKSSIFEAMVDQNALPLSYPKMDRMVIDTAIQSGLDFMTAMEMCGDVIQHELFRNIDENRPILMETAVVPTKYLNRAVQQSEEINLVAVTCGDDIRENETRMRFRAIAGGMVFETQDLESKQLEYRDELKKWMPRVSYACIIDTREEPKIVMEMNKGQLIYLDPQMPLWVQELSKSFGSVVQTSEENQFAESLKQGLNQIKQKTPYFVGAFIERPHIYRYVMRKLKEAQLNDSEVIDQIPSLYHLPPYQFNNAQITLANKILKSRIENGLSTVVTGEYMYALTENHFKAAKEKGFNTEFLFVADERDRYTHDPDKPQFLKPLLQSVDYGKVVFDDIHRRHLDVLETFQGSVMYSYGIDSPWLSQIANQLPRSEIDFLMDDPFIQKLWAPLKIYLNEFETDKNRLRPNDEIDRGLTRLIMQRYLGRFERGNL
ncbi:Predicted ABC-type ATPase [Seinonella peptonophila]|uniref:Predicted ABC-type ATPase n=1 Tax=Seinonella peptonophila TaxID=112248 RepID=A0A1M4Y670_9BACL|nr:hypothetical protein [Seinonella peptonophila]SHF01169.1 Predicted ABC-type ATPase [Seinonella peptonophila]